MYMKLMENQKVAGKVNMADKGSKAGSHIVSVQLLFLLPRLVQREDVAEPDQDYILRNIR